MWTTTLADNMTTCEKYFAYCGPGIYIPIQHIQPGRKGIGKRYLKDKDPKKDPKRGREGMKGNQNLLTPKYEAR